MGSLIVQENRGIGKFHRPAPVGKKSEGGFFRIGGAKSAILIYNPLCRPLSWRRLERKT